MWQIYVQECELYWCLRSQVDRRGLVWTKFPWQSFSMNITDMWVSISPVGIKCRVNGIWMGLCKCTMNLVISNQYRKSKKINTQFGSDACRAITTLFTPHLSPFWNLRVNESYKTGTTGSLGRTIREHPRLDKKPVQMLSLDSGDRKTAMKLWRLTKSPSSLRRFDLVVLVMSLPRGRLLWWTVNRRKEWMDSLYNNGFVGGPGASEGWNTRF